MSIVRAFDKFSRPRMFSVQTACEVGVNGAIAAEEVAEWFRDAQRQSITWELRHGIKCPIVLNDRLLNTFPFWTIEEIESALYVLQRAGAIEIERREIGLFLSLPAEDAAEYLAEREDESEAPAPVKRKLTAGFVYLIKGGNYYKIGRARDVPRRVREFLRLQMPFDIEVVGTIETDDAWSTEKAWHNHFADQRANGEWFDLSASDVAEFMAHAKPWEGK